MECSGARNGVAGGLRLVEQEKGLSPGRGEVIVLAARLPFCRLAAFEHRAGERRCLVRLAGKEPHGGGVDPRIVSAAALVRCLVESSGCIGLCGPGIAVRGESLVLSEPGGERSDLLVPDAFEPEPAE